MGRRVRPGRTAEQPARHRHVSLRGLRRPAAEKQNDAGPKEDSLAAGRRRDRDRAWVAMGLAVPCRQKVLDFVVGADRERLQLSFALGVLAHYLNVAVPP